MFLSSVEVRQLAETAPSRQAAELSFLLGSAEEAKPLRAIGQAEPIAAARFALKPPPFCETQITPQCADLLDDDRLFMTHKVVVHTAI